MPKAQDSLRWKYTMCDVCALLLACHRSKRERDRTRSEAQPVLEERIRRLEARLAESELNQQHNSDEDYNIQWEPTSVSMRERSPVPQLHVDTDFSRYRSRSCSVEDGASANLSACSLDVPLIEITSCETGASHKFSRSSSLTLSASSRASTPDPYLVPSPLLSPTWDQAFSPPVQPYFCGDPAVDDEFNRLRISQPVSRRSSGASEFMGFDLNCPFDLDSLDHQQQHGYFDLRVSGASYPYIQTSTSQDITPRFEPPSAQPQQQLCEPAVLPPKSDAETISQAYFSHSSNEQPYLDRSTFQFCLNAVYSLPNPHAQLDLTAATILSSTPYSFQTAKFHVFIVLATGIRLLGEQLGEGFNGLLENCYKAAMSQVAEVGMDFWERPGGAEAAMLLAAFGKARGGLVGGEFREL